MSFAMPGVNIFKRLVLASGSPRRKEILTEKGGLTGLCVCPSTFEEQNKGTFSDCNLYDYIIKIATGKVKQVADADRDKMPPETYSSSSLYIGADTVVFMDGVKYEKPTSSEDAFQMLKSFSGKSHQVCTAVVLLVPDSFPTATASSSGKLLSHEDGYFIHSFTETATVEFGDLSDQLIRDYIATGDPMDKAGGYGIQGVGAPLVKGIKGDFYNVMGFPLHKFCLELSSFLDKLTAKS